MKDKILTAGLRLARKKKYGGAITLMEGEILHYRDSFRFYYILALACLRAGDFGRAYTYFKSAYDIKTRDVNVLLGIAALNVKRGESARAVDLYLKVLDAEPNNKKANAALTILRKYGGSDELREWVESGRIQRLYPPFPPMPLDMRRCAAAGGAAFALAALGIITAARFNFITLSFMPERSLRKGFTVSALSPKEKTTLVETGGAYELILTDQQVLETFEEARGNFNAYRDNSARRAVNKLMMSNASDGIKNKARILLGFLDEVTPGFDTLSEHFTYNDVARDGALYKGCYVIWSGMTANIDVEEKATSFDLLVGYEKRQNLLGIVRVRCPFAFTVDKEKSIEVLGRVLPQSGGGFALEGVSVHQR